jgi:hypothetical protein
MFTAVLVLTVKGSRIPALMLGTFPTLAEAQRVCQNHIQLHGMTLKWSAPERWENDDLPEIPASLKLGASTWKAGFSKDGTEYSFAITGKDNEPREPQRIKRSVPQVRTDLVVVKAWNKHVVLGARDFLRGPSEGQAFHLARQTRWGQPKLTLCGKRVARPLVQFRPSEATCKECLRYAGIR